MDGMITWRISRFFKQGGAEEIDDRVVVELPLEIIVNGMPLVALMRLPGMDKELAVGFCLTEKIIDDVRQVKLLKHCGQREEAAGRSEEAASDGEAGENPLDRGNVVELEVESPHDRERFTPTYVVRTGCGGADLSALEDYAEGVVDSPLRVAAGLVMELGEKLAAGQDIFHATGGTHGAGIFDTEGRVLVVSEDVGRHNALDKAVGWCALRSVPLEDKILMLSGRVSYEMALKAVRVRIPVVVSLAAPTSLGLRVAERAGLTVVGFCGGERCNVYTHGWRVKP